VGSNYLKKYYLEDNKLAQRARLEFFRALSTGRMIAFTGSMATQAFGYGSWEQLRMAFSALAGDAVEHSGASIRDVSEASARIKRFEERSAARTWTTPVGMSLIEEVLEKLGPAEPEWPNAVLSNSRWPLDHCENLREAMRAALALRFRVPQRGWRIDRPGSGVDPGQFDERFNVPAALWNALGIRRFATPSYDFEIERIAMLGDQPREGADGSFTSPFNQLAALRRASGENFSWDLGSGRIRRVFADGWAIESDLLNRERIDRMIEFAVGTDDVDGHVMHLHGRACNWRTIIASQRDYDNLYRRNDLNRGPFEFAKRMMMGGNPILFVGLGMGETELNSEMQEFISNNPYQRVAPTFLLWSARPEQLNPDQIAAKRIDYLRRLGVLTIFDTDFEPLRDHDPDHIYVPQSPRSKVASDQFCEKISSTRLDEEVDFDEPDISNRQDLHDLKHGIDLLTRGIGDAADAYCNPAVRERHVGRSWRSMEGRVLGATQAEPPRPVVLWNVISDEAPKSADWLPKIIEKSQTARILCIIGSQGCGKGSVARTISNANAQDLCLQSVAQCMLINGGFTFDTDTVLDGLARFFSHTFDQRLEAAPGALPGQSRRVFFRRLALNGDVGRDDPRALVIMNGMERFFDIAGQPLSAELDELLALASRPFELPETDTAGLDPKSSDRRARWIMFGTERVRKYMEGINAEIWDFNELNAGADQRDDQADIPGRYLNSVWQMAKRHMRTPGEMPAPLRQEVARYHANQPGRISGDSTELRRALFGAIFDEVTLGKILGESASPSNIATAREILKALAFIGLPIEIDILQMMPALKDRALVEETLKALWSQRLVLPLAPYRNPTPPYDPDAPRYALHRSLLTELRYRYGIPLSEAKLSTAFNMSLYVAQPIDGDIPDTDIHDELGDAIDRLIGSYRIVPGAASSLPAHAANLGIAPEDYRQSLASAAAACGASRRPVTDEQLSEIERLCSARHARALRAALALVRSYYSTTGLLTLDSGDRLIREGRDGVLLEHAERLDDLIDAYGKMSIARESLKKGIHDLWIKDIANDADRVKKAEEALQVFQRAFGNIDPFYADELVWLHNERGVVRLAMGDLHEARRSFDQAMTVNRQWVERDDRAHNWRRIRLNQLTVDIEMGDIGVAERKCEEIIRESSRESFVNQLREDKLAIAIATGYQAWCLHLRGRADRALDKYKAACGLLSALSEVRAQAYFERLRANAFGSTNDPKEHLLTLERALNLAQSAVQMDIVHRLQVTWADTQLFKTEPTLPHERQRAHRYLEEALTYAIHTDVHRVRCEASMATAKARLQMSDFDGALRYATDAMMVATRYGMELRKISLRALIAKVMAARGHPVTAEHLARTCIKMATRQRYQTAIEEAAQVITDIPRISIAISSSDRSGRRNF
jgi:tetratricopeptide (TPR) repeat protein